MKILILFFILIFSFHLNSQELLLHYNFDNNVDDLSGNEYSGNPSGVTFVADRNGNPNSAVSFDGVNDFIDFPNISELKPTLPVSFSFWIKYESNNVQDRVVFNTSFKEDVNSGIYLTTQSSTGKLAVGFGDGSSSFTSSNRRGYLSDNVIQKDAWHQIHIVISSNTNMKVYLDCVETGGSYSGNGSGLNYSSNPGSLGRHDQNSTAVASYYFKGVLDDFKYYKGEIIPTIKTTNFVDLPVEICTSSVYSLPTESSNGVGGNWSPVFDSSIIGTTVYTFIPDTGQCASRFSHSIEIKKEIIPVFTNLETALCEGTSYSLPTISINEIEGSWLPAFDSSATGTNVYTFTPTSSSCASSLTHSIEITNEITPIFTNLEAVLCEGTAYSLPTTSINGIEGGWLPVFDSSIIGTAVYTFTPASSFCASSLDHSIEISNEITPIFTNLETVLCEGTSYSLPSTSITGIEGSWLPVFDGSSLGTTVYTFTPTSSSCVSSLDHSIEITNEIAPIFTNLETVLCEDISYSLPTTSINNIEGSWLPVFDSSIIGPQVYTFTPTSSSCASSLTHSIEITNEITPIFTNLETVFCEGTAYSLPTTSINGIEGGWLPVFDSSAIGITVYKFAPDLNQCVMEINHTIEIKQRETPIFSDLPKLILKNENYSLPNISDNGILGNWNPFFDSSLIGKVTYTFTPINIDCNDIFSHIIAISNELTIPLFFTPNNDTINDFWKISGLDSFTGIELSIFDRYGKLLSKLDPNTGWDGIYNGKEMIPNDYWYLLSAVNLNDEIIIRRGHFSLLK